MTPTLSPVTPLTWFDAHFCLCECTLLSFHPTYSYAHPAVWLTHAKFSVLNGL